MADNEKTKYDNYSEYDILTTKDMFQIALFCRKCFSLHIYSCKRKGCNHNVFTPYGENYYNNSGRLDFDSVFFEPHEGFQEYNIKCCKCQKSLGKFNTKGGSSGRLEEQIYTLDFVKLISFSCPHCMHYETDDEWKKICIKLITPTTYDIAYEHMPDEIKELKQIAEDERLDELMPALKEVDALLNNLLESNHLIIDSNIWMNIDYDSFFDCISHKSVKANKRLKMSREQFDQICILKQKAKFRSRQSSAARCAIGRIEELQKLGILELINIGKNSKGAHRVEVLLIDYTISLLKNGESVHFVTNNIELRIRLRSLSHPYEDKLEIIELPEMELFSDLHDLIERDKSL